MALSGINPIESSVVGDHTPQGRDTALLRFQNIGVAAEFRRRRCSHAGDRRSPRRIANAVSYSAPLATLILQI